MSSEHNRAAAAPEQRKTRSTSASWKSRNNHKELSLLCHSDVPKQIESSKGLNTK